QAGDTSGLQARDAAAGGLTCSLAGLHCGQHSSATGGIHFLGLFSPAPALAGRRRKDSAESAVTTPITIKPQITSASASSPAPRTFMLRIMVTAAVATPRLMPSCWAMAEKLLARLMERASRSA